MMNRFTSCIIVGAGMAGLVAASRLQQAGMRVVVLDKDYGETIWFYVD